MPLPRKRRREPHAANPGQQQQQQQSPANLARVPGRHPPRGRLHVGCWFHRRQRRNVDHGGSYPRYRHCSGHDRSQGWAVPRSRFGRRGQDLQLAPVRGPGAQERQRGYRGRRLCRLLLRRRRRQGVPAPGRRRLRRHIERDGGPQPARLGNHDSAKAGAQGGRHPQAPADPVRHQRPLQHGDAGNAVCPEQRRRPAYQRDVEAHADAGHDPRATQRAGKRDRRHRAHHH